jgi:hypothetical protein
MLIAKTAAYRRAHFHLAQDELNGSIINGISSS